MSNVDRGGAVAPAEAVDSGRRSLREQGLVPKWAMVGVLLAMVVVFSATMSDMFFTYENLRVILTTQSVLAILAIGMCVPLIVGHFDLSVGGNVAVSNVLCISLMTDHGVPIWLSVLIALAISAFIGILNGLLVTRVGINALVSTLGMGTLLGGIVLAYTGGATISQGVPVGVTKIASRTLLGMPLPVFYMIIIALVVWYFLDRTPSGRHFYAIGGSADAARMAGVNVGKLTMAAFVICATLAGVAGVVTSARVGVGNPTVGPAMLFPAFAAALLGAAAIKPGTYNIAGTIVAVFTLAVGVAGLQLAGVPFWVENLFNGSAIILAVTLTRFLRREAL